MKIIYFLLLTIIALVVVSVAAYAAFWPASSNLNQWGQITLTMAVCMLFGFVAGYNSGKQTH